MSHEPRGYAYQFNRVWIAPCCRDAAPSLFTETTYQGSTAYNLGIKSGSSLTKKQTIVYRYPPNPLTSAVYVIANLEEPCVPVEVFRARMSFDRTCNV
jgi:hypothetical protein